MPIDYACIAKNGIIQDEYPARQHQIKGFVMRILKNMPPQEHKYTWFKDDKNYHYQNTKLHTVKKDSDDRYTYFCVAGIDYSYRLCYDMIAELAEKHQASLRENKSLRTILRETVAKYNNPEKFDTFYKVKNKIANLKEDMIQNVEKIMQNLEKVDSLVEKTGDVCLF